jgi:preprotein translocase subunit SecA
MSQKWQAITDSVEELHRRQRPVLMGTSSIADSEHIASLLSSKGLDFQLLNGRQDAEEAEIIANAGQRRAITIATSLAGRGTDIKLGPGVSDLGGLHVIVSACSDSSRVDRQLIGRGARQGDPGSAQMFVSADDGLVQQHGSWLATSIRRHSGPNGETPIDLTPQLRRIQRSAERAGYAARCQLLRKDLSRDSLFSRQSLDS